ncbi:MULTISPECIES: oxidoreductase [unclassified Burkholderia]|uniref:oxidoreductase n=1 Tax=unclassified Burkholderia TaxID=2613784 RepID=UPI00142367CB|nr:MULTISPECIES: oxidoreductase [unclassified Burkholderia]NIE57215.1 oxidoreductase [Burkholderia sp. Ap-955]NIF12924.1 oxidoreductase [Burkholderia sp. Ax-1735]NIG06016.1 oxidoreductase [Burkholderia sp. Tr-849]
MASGKLMLITGVSSGFGRALAQEALAEGYTVVGTVRSAQAAQDFDALSAQAFARVLDVTDFDRIDGVVADIEANVGPVDVLVNNAGYGHEGIMEEAPLAEMRRQFDVNVFGAVAMMKAVIPTMRERRRGHILNITSMGGHITMPGIAYYCGSKFALEGMTETVGKELEPFGIAVTAVAPGSFRTDWAGRSMARTPRSIADYDALFDPIRRAREEKSGKQLGDPAKAARAMLAVIAAERPPSHLLLGSDALRLVRGKLAALDAEIRAWEAVTVSTDG